MGWKASPRMKGKPVRIDFGEQAVLPVHDEEAAFRAGSVLRAAGAIKDVARRIHRQRFDVVVSTQCAERSHLARRRVE